MLTKFVLSQVTMALVLERMLCDTEMIANRTLFIFQFETIIVELGQQSLKVMDTSKLGNLIVSDGSFKQFAESKNLTRALSSNSDLVAGVYEGLRSKQST